MPQWLIDIPADFWSVLSEMAPYLLFGFLAAGVLSVVISARLVERHLGGRGIWPVVKAAAFGVPMPLCSCGVIPVGATLRRQGASRGATVAFLIATPQDGVDSILVTLGLLGPVFAVFRPIAALLGGVIGGSVAAAVDPGRADAEPLAAEPDETARGDNRHGKVRRALAYAFGTLPRDIGRAVLLGLLVAALISALIPKDYFARYVPPGIAQVVLLMVAGIPVYVCATASVPVALALIHAGISPGAAFAFLMTGPATNAATIVTVWKVLGRRTALVYLGTMAAVALAGGLLLDQFLSAEAVVGNGHAAGWMLPDAVKWAAAVVLIGVLGVGVFRPGQRHEDKHGASEAAARLNIKGMTCSHCVETVRRALLGCEGVTDARVDLRSGVARISGENVDEAALRDAVESVGYSVVSGPQ